MMKTLYKLRLAVLAIFMVFGSCTDIIDIEPTHLLTGENAFQSLDDVEAHLTGLYAYTRSGAMYGNAAGQLQDMMTDNLREDTQSLGNWRNLVDWQYVANNGSIAAYWQTLYALINDANILINGIDQFDEDVDGRKNRILGQTLALRSWAYFYLQAYWGQEYERNSTALSVPIKLESNLDEPARATVVEVYDRIFDDLEEAHRLLQNTDQAINANGNPSRIDAAVVNAMRARVSLYAGEYQDAANYSSDVINAGFSLATGVDFRTIWTDDNAANEVIWGVVYRPGEGAVGGNVYFSVNDRVAFSPAEDLLALFQAEDDVRYASYFSDQTVLRPGELVISKYLGRAGATDGNVNFKAFRLGEMYLIRAEANARLGNNVAALEDLNTLRAARIENSEDVSLGGDALLTAIANERRRELFLEGHRWFDLRRTNMGIERGTDCAPPATACELEASSFRWAWPIPQGELDANDNINNDTQNPGY